MRAMCSQRKDQLHQQFVAVAALRVSAEAILSTKLAEFAGPISQRRGETFVPQIVELAPVGPVEAPATEPSPSKLVIPRRVKTETALLTRELLPLAPDEFAASNKRMIDGTPQRLPTNGRINSVELRNKVARQSQGSVVVTTRV